MTGLDKILNEIQKESEDKVSRIIREAEDKALEISKAAEKETAAQLKAIEDETAKREKDIADRAKSSGELSVRKAVLIKKREIIDEIIKETEESLYNLPEKEYFEFLGKLLDKFAHSEKGEILLNKQDKERLPKDFEEALSKKGLSVSQKEISEKGGFILVYGDIEEKCTFDALLSADGEKIMDTVMKTVFE